MNVGLFAGSFDPFTLGHYDITVRAAKLFSHLYVGVAGDTGNKKCKASLDERTEIAKKSLAGVSHVTVCPFDGFLTDFAREIGAYTVVRGLRTFKDFEYEQTIAKVYKSQWSEIELLYLISSPEYSHVSATVVRDLVNGSGNLDGYVCGGASASIQNIYGRR